jgi:hypothetical protein
MHDIPTSSQTIQCQTAVVGFITLTGRQLARSARQLNPTARAVLSEQLRAGSVQVMKLTAGQARRLSGASFGYANALHRATRQEWDDVVSGRRKLADLVNKPMSDAALDKLIIKLGPGRVMAALDRHTSPSLVAAE